MLILFGLTGNALLAQVSGDSTNLDSTHISPSTKRYKASFDAEVNYSAKDSIRIYAQKKIIVLYGDAEVYYKEMEIRAAIISINFETQVMEAIPVTDSLKNELGIPFFKDKDQEMTAKKIQYNFKSKKGIIYGLVTEQAEGFVYGNKVKKDAEDNMYIENARYTTCQDTTHPHFYIQARKMKVIPGKKIISGPAWLHVADVPTPALVPFGYFPVTKGRASGVLFPQYGYSADRGYFLRNGGYYFGISDRLDMALTGDIYANLSWRLNATSYYAKRYRYNGNLSLEYAVNKRNEREDPDFSKTGSYFIRWNHAMDSRARPNTTFNANVNMGSTSFLKLNSYNPNDIVSNTLASSVNYSRAFRFGSLNLSARQDQNNQSGQVNMTLPDLNFDVFRFYPFRRAEYNASNARFYEDIGMTYSTSFRNQLSTIDSVFLTPETLKKLQYGMNHVVNVAGNFKILKHIAFSPGANYTEYWYMSTVSKRWDDTAKQVVTDTIPGFKRGYAYDINASFSTIVYGMYQFGKGKVQAIRHVVTPVVSVSLRPDFARDRFGFYERVQSDSTGNLFQQYSVFEKGIYGGPGAGKSGLVNLTLGNNLEMKVKDSKDTVTGTRKIKLLEVLSFATSYNILADSMKWAPLVIQARTTVFGQVNVQFNSTLNPYGMDSAGRAINTRLREQTGRWFRLTSMQIYVTTALNSETLKGKKTPGRVRPIRNPYMTSQELALLDMPGGYVDFNIPWNFTFNYVFTVNKPGLSRMEIQTLNFSGDFKLTGKWKIGFSSGYDITGKQMSMTTLDFYRDLHCWEFRFNWMPFGDRQYFTFSLNGKASALQDLKLNRRRDWFDR